MSKIDELIQHYCPDGVEYKNIYDVCSFTRGKTITKAKTIEGNVPVIAGGQKPAYYHGEYNRNGESVVIAGSGAYAGFVSFWNMPIWVSDAFTIEPINDKIILTKYIYFLLESKQKWLYSLKKGSGVPHVYGKDLSSLTIPVPPIKVQQEIVRILDTFTQLEAELEAELSLRKKQYEYYRNQLLTFDEDDTDVEWKTLGEIGNLCMCKRIFKNQTTDYGDVPFYKIGTFGGKANAFISKELFNDYKQRFSYPSKGSLLISCSGTIGKIVEFDGTPSYFQDSNIVWIDNDETKVTNQFLKHYYAIVNFPISKGGTIGRLYGKDIKAIQIPVPPLSEQQRMVDILDKFDLLVNNISQGIPAEIEARRKQYEYYRDKLLSFKNINTQ